MWADAAFWEPIAEICGCFFDLRTQPLSYGVIWIDRRSSKDLFVLNFGTTNWSHMKNKGTKQKSKKKGSENVFGCDLIEHLQNSGQDGKLFFMFSLTSNTQFLVTTIK